jgi:hypothetical protein
MASNSLPGTLSTARSQRGIGFVDYVEGDRSIPFWCRRGAGKVLAYIYCPVASEWQARYAWGLARKAEITTLVIEHFRSKFPASVVAYDTEAIVALRGPGQKTAEPGASPNGGPATSPANSGAQGGPPSVS